MLWIVGSPTIIIIPWIIQNVSAQYKRLILNRLHHVVATYLLHACTNVCSGVTGGEGAPDTPYREISVDLPGKEREGKKGKLEEKRRKIVKKEVENLKWKKWKEEMLQNEEIEDLFFFLSFFFLLFTFQNHWNLFWVYQNRNFLLGKSISCQEKDFAPSEKYSSYAPECVCVCDVSLCKKRQYM